MRPCLQCGVILRFDQDPYLVISNEGRLFWIVDAYTSTDQYPYSARLRGVGNYIRNSVKGVVDAYHGHSCKSRRFHCIVGERRFSSWFS